MRLMGSRDRLVVLVKRQDVAVEAGALRRTRANVALALLATADVIAGNVEYEPMVPAVQCQKSRRGTLPRHGTAGEHDEPRSQLPSHSATRARAAYHSPNLGSARDGASGSVITKVYSLPALEVQLTVGVARTCAGVRTVPSDT